MDLVVLAPFLDLGSLGFLDRRLPAALEVEVKCV